MKRMLIAAACGLAVGSAGAQGYPSITWSGYGTVGVAHSNDDRADYLVDAFKPNGPGHTDNVSLKVDTRLGGQATVLIAPRLSAVVQALVQQSYDDRWKPVVEWANVKYQATDALSLRAGRVVLPIFMVTDSRLVGYANPWVRPPVELYSLVPVTHNDGADLAWRAPLGGATHNLQLTVGRSDSHFPNASGFDAGMAAARRIAAINDSVEIGAFTGRVTYGEARLTIAAYKPLFDAFRQFAAVGGAAIADRYDVQDRRVSFAGVGATYDPGAWFVMGEWARFDTRSIVGKRSAGYVSAGVRYNKITPYVTYARLKAESPHSDPGLPVALLPAQVAPTAAQLNAALNRQLGALPEQSTVSVGARWDFMRSAALKLQWDRVQKGAGSYGTFGNVQPDFPLGGRVDVFSAVVDFLF